MFEAGPTGPTAPGGPAGPGSPVDPVDPTGPTIDAPKIKYLNLSTKASELS